MFSSFFENFNLSSYFRTRQDAPLPYSLFFVSYLLFSKAQAVHQFPWQHGCTEQRMRH